ncbi:ATP-binding protein [Streptomyces sp. NPDC088847]|uniref:ATP-binding protein n=1 Tax=Streptomyces sp. NPDC088847 TaxID=3365909 RepID=UPI0037FC8FC9
MSDVFVGRADEQNRLRLLLGQLDGAGPDEGRVVLVRGQGGVGKSTLLARMREIVAEERPRSGWRRRRLTTVFLDWGEDPLRSVVAASADGPEVWRLLAAVEAAFEEACGAAAERAFDDFRRQASHLPEMVERAKKLMLHEHGGAQLSTAFQFSPKAASSSPHWRPAVSPQRWPVISPLLRWQVSARGSPPVRRWPG